MNQQLIAATQSAGCAVDKSIAKSTRLLQELILADWQPDEALVVDAHGAVAGWDISRLILPKASRLKDGEITIYALSNLALHLGYSTKQGMFGNAPAHLRIPWAKVDSVEFSVVGPVHVVVFEAPKGQQAARLQFQDYPGLDGPNMGVMQASRIEVALRELLS